MWFSIGVLDVVVIFLTLVLCVSCTVRDLTEGAICKKERRGLVK
jgi:hypothetical protein